MLKIKGFQKFKRKVNDFDKYHHIHPSVLLHITWKNFTNKKLRSFLTVFGVVIGVSAVFFLISFGLGIQSLVTEQVIGDSSLKSIDVSSPNSKIVTLSEDVINKIRTYAHVDSVGTQYSFPGITSFDGGEIDTVVYGIDKNYQDLSSLTIVKGRLLDESDNKDVVINSGALEALGISDASSAIGKQIHINVPLEKYQAKQSKLESDFTIVGVIDSGSGSEVYIPSGLFDVTGVPAYSNVKVVVDDLTNVDNVRKHIEAIGLETSSLTDTLNEINNIFSFFNLLLVGFGSIGMIVAILGMFNTLTISLLERTKEIGLMIALGGRRADMFKLFTLEALMISFFGSIIGITIAFVIGKILNIFLNLKAQARGVEGWFDLFATPWWLVILTILASLVIGLIVVYLPARRAEKVNPIDALSRE